MPWSLNNCAVYDLSGSRSARSKTRRPILKKNHVYKTLSEHNRNDHHPPFSTGYLIKIKVPFISNLPLHPPSAFT
jgi:hypothetical protein